MTPDSALRRGVGDRRGRRWAQVLELYADLRYQADRVSVEAFVEALRDGDR